jgi:sulfide dehydrogenase cytochrome subunit
MTRLKRARRLALAGAVFSAGLGLAAAATADETAPAVLAAPCQSCHGTGGTSPGAIPSLVDLDAMTIEAAMLAFRTSTDATIMNRLSRGYTDAEIHALALEIDGWTE